MQPNLKKRAFALAGVSAALALGALMTSCTTVNKPVVAVKPALPGAGPDANGTVLTPPPAPREFRAAWVSTVANIDWPSKAGLSADKQ